MVCVNVQVASVLKNNDKNHNYYIYPDLLNVALPKFVAEIGRYGRRDIPFQPTGSQAGLYFLSLPMLKCCLCHRGHALQTLETEGPESFLEMAISF